MKLKIAFLIGWAACFFADPCYSQRAVPPAYTGPVNYVRSWDAMAPTTNPADILTMPNQDVKMATAYIDGLGRPLQTVVKKGSLTTGASATDMVSMNEYDVLGREVFKYLPYAESSANAGTFKTNPFAAQATFMSATYGAGIQDEDWFYAQTDIEPSPLNRPAKQMAPGNNWVGAARGVSTKYWHNTGNDIVRKFTVTASANTLPTCTTTGTYNAGELTKMITVDEHDKQVITFTDKDGKIILKKVQLTATADDGTGKNYSGWLSTFYIYDIYNNLRCVIQPKGVELLITNSWSMSNTVGLSIVSEQCFQYAYDLQNRMTIKKVPGAGEVYMLYDKKDRLVMMQDANMRVPNPDKWLYTTYDAVNRVESTGLIDDNTNLAGHQSSIAGAPIANAYPNLGSYTEEELTRSFYTDYTWLATYSNPLPGSYNTAFNTYLETTVGTYPYPQPNIPSAAIKGMVTGNRTKILGTSNYLYSTIFYDAKGRPIQVQSTNITGGVDIITTQYSWAGQPVVTVQKQQNANSPAQTAVIVSKNSYDELGRVIKTEKKQSHTAVIVGGVMGDMTPYKIMSENYYDKLGQLKTKKLGTTEDPSTFPPGVMPLENLAYEYNIRGWMLGMNRDYIATTGQSGSKKFGFELAYDKLNSSSSRSYTATQYNGNITGMVWKSDGDDVRRKYDFSYDPANRLMQGLFEQDDAVAAWGTTNANYKMLMGSNGTDIASAYDANGNIKRMQQWGLKINTSPQIDDLVYTYEKYGVPGSEIEMSNKLSKVIDGIATDNKLGDFKDGGSGSGTDYSYDANGNLSLDNNKAISSITYNHLNLPAVINVTGKGTITYTYDAAGIKLKKTVAETGQPVKTTLYLSGAVYENDVLQFIPHEEGRIRFKPVLGLIPASLQYDYMIKDHLGNVRMVLTEEKKEDTYQALSFEGTTPEINDQNATWENAAGNPFDVIARRTTSPAPLQAYAGNPVPGTQSLMIQSSVTGKFGAGKLLKVMSGDKIHTTVQYYYNTNTGTGTTNGLNTLVTALATMLTNSVGALPVVKDGAATINTVLSGDGVAQTFFNNQSGANNGRPKAFLNVLFFDERFKFDGNTSFSKQIDASSNPGQIVLALGSAREAAKNGYCYVYISNETDDIVYFDNFTLTHEHGPILEETHYYPFGLTMSGISSKSYGGLENKNKWNSGAEFNEGLGVDFYETFYRGLDPQIGKFWQVDPKPNYSESLYASMANNPISFSDFLGDTILYGEGIKGEIAKLMVEKFTSKTITNDKGEVTRNKNYNAAFSEKISKLDKAVDNFIFSVDAKAKEGSVSYDGANVLVTIGDPGDAYGTKNPMEGILFEETAHAEQFLDGKTYFQRRSSGQWGVSTNLDNEVAAKMFVIDNFSINNNYEEKTTGNNYLVPTQLGYLKSTAKSQGKRKDFLQHGAEVSVHDAKGDKYGQMHIPAAYPDFSNLPMSTPLTSRTQNSRIFGYPNK